MRIRETNESEPLMMCRNPLSDDVKTGETVHFRDKSKRKPDYCLVGIRHTDGVNLI